MQKMLSTQKLWENGAIDFYYCVQQFSVFNSFRVSFLHFSMDVKSAPYYSFSNHTLYYIIYSPEKAGHEQTEANLSILIKAK
jgi:hypothetical protein